MMTTTPPDAARLRATADFVREQDGPGLLQLLLPGLDGPELRALVERCRFAHAALLVCPPDLETLRAELADCGLAADEPRPSVVVRARLAARHRRGIEEFDVRILRARVAGADGARRTVEVLALAVPPDSELAGIAAYERDRQHEAHLAFEVERPDPLVLHGLRAILLRRGAVADGGGYNPYEDGTVLYFTAPADSKAGYRRMELSVRGDHRDVLEAHLREHAAQQPAETMLRLLTGAWTTQALATVAEMRVPDAMSADEGRGVEALAARTGTDPDSLARVLRYLTALDVVAQDRDGFRLTRLGELLREDAPHSMRAPALMYGGPFYQSFAHLGHTLRTGGEAFRHLFGENHFAYFARHPELAELFDQSMAASSRMFEPLPEHPVFARDVAGEGAADTATGAAPDAAARLTTVVDIAGGNGELLGRLLTAHPHLRGVLLERPHAIEAARHALDAAGCGERCAYRAGDFEQVPTGGDVYILSRVLHDRDDERCREILGHCARAMPDHADLLIVERVLPADGSASLAAAWDLHMMCNVGGRERRADHYARLLADAGLALVGHTRLPLDAALLHARKSGQ
jgi:hypothetical protein